MTPSAQLNPTISGPLPRQVRALRMTWGPRAVQSKNTTKQNKHINQSTWTRKGLNCWDASHRKLSCTCLWKLLTHSRHIDLGAYTQDMCYVLALYYHDWRNKLQCRPAQSMFQHRFTTYRMHHKNAYFDKKEPKRRERQQEKYEERDEKETILTIKVRSKIKKINKN